jgi:LysM repeat protein
VFEDDNDESGFWSNVPTSRFDRLNAKRHKAKLSRAHQPSPPAGSRSHDDTKSIPVVAAAASQVGATRHVDPLLRRTGTLAVVIALLVPVALALRSSHEPARDTALQPQTSVAVTESPFTTAAEVVVAAAASPVSAAGAPATIDIEALPEAVPAHTAAPATTAAKASKSAPSTAVPAVATEAAAPKAKVEQVVIQRAPCASKYTVKAGDAWVLIAKRVGVSTKELLAANGATARTAIYPGRDICLPANATVATARPTTTTKPASKSVTKASTPAPKTTTAPKATTPPVKETPPAKVYSKAEVAQIIRDVWPDDLEDEAIRIATRESNLVPSVKNYCCYGLFQIYYNVHKGWLAQIGVSSGSQLWDPRTNALAAFVLYQRSNSFAPWN